MENTDFYTELSIKYGELNHYIEWCRDNCTDKWSINILTEAGNQPGNYLFKFKNSTYYTTFILWKS